jgi:hypothetical protein
VNIPVQTFEAASLIQCSGSIISYVPNQY